MSTEKKKLSGLFTTVVMFAFKIRMPPPNLDHVVIHFTSWNCTVSYVT